MSILLLGDFSLVLLTSLQLYSISLLDFLLVLSILPLGILFPFPAGIRALFSHGPRRAANLARVYALWNVISMVNVVSSLARPDTPFFSLIGIQIFFSYCSIFACLYLDSICGLAGGSLCLRILSLQNSCKQRSYEYTVLEFQHVRVLLRQQ